MSETYLDYHIQRIRQETTRKLGRAHLAAWIEENTKINGKPFSFKGHEYQKKILQDESQEIVIIKAAQTGISEMALRMSAGLMALMPQGFTLGYTLPTASAASTYSRTRFDPIVRDSPPLKASISEGSMDNGEVKEFAGGRILYFKGCSVGGQAISTTISALCHDELSHSDPEIIGDYTSRMVHSEYKWRWKFSTPTYPGDAIDEAFKNSRRNFNFCRCSHCNHFFIPDYYSHVKIPGFDKDLREITKRNLHEIRHSDAALHCPACGKIPNLLPEHREWVCENPDAPYIAAGYKVSPFDAPTIVTPAYLVGASTSYATRAKFDQFNLGQASEDAESGLTREDMDAIGVEMAQSPFNTHVIGCDMGILCRLMVGGVTQTGEVIVVHAEAVPINSFKKRYQDLCRQYRVTAKVLDAQPYVETIMSIQETDMTLFGAFYVRKERLELFDISTREENMEEGKLAMRQVQINKNNAMDMLMEEIRAKRFLIRKTELWEDICQQMTDMKRQKVLNANKEFVNQWIKSTQKNDHFHNAALYLFIAVKLRAVTANHSPMQLPGVASFRLKVKA